MGSLINTELFDLRKIGRFTGFIDIVMDDAP
jgi:hypothetical protein